MLRRLRENQHLIDRLAVDAEIQQRCAGSSRRSSRRGESFDKVPLSSSSTSAQTQRSIRTGPFLIRGRRPVSGPFYYRCSHQTLFDAVIRLDVIIIHCYYYILSLTSVSKAPDRNGGCRMSRSEHLLIWRRAWLDCLLLQFIGVLTFASLAINLPAHAADENIGTARKSAQLQQSCNSGDALDCDQLGANYLFGDGVAQNSKAAEFYLKRACDRSIWISCTTLAVMYDTGDGVEQNSALAAKLDDDACNGGNGVGCFNLANKYRIGDGVKRSMGLAAQLFEYACQDGTMRGCHNLAVQYDRGDGVVQNNALAEQLFAKACNGGDASACRPASEPAPMHVANGPVQASNAQAAGIDNDTNQHSAAPSDTAGGPALTKALDGLVRTDSLGWATNRYDVGSMTNVQIVEGSVQSGHYTIRGDYTYNGGSSGWVMARMSGTNLDCILFHDSWIGCRALRAPGQGQALVLALVTAAMANSAGSTSSGSSQASANDECDSLCQGKRQEEWMINQNNERIHQEEVESRQSGN
jgi:TPR repeat protein